VETKLHGPNYPEPPPDILEGDPEFEVKQIVGSRQVGRKKMLQYKVQWKGYSLAHDSWEPASQVHASDLIEEFRKIRPSEKKNATINCGSASGTMTKLNLPQQHRAYSSQTEERRHQLNINTEKDDKRDSSLKDKRKRENQEIDIITPPFLRINFCTMDNNEDRLPPPLSIEELCNMDLSGVNPGKKIYDELLRVMDETYNDPT
jgi:hypothetical protein